MGCCSSAAQNSKREWKPLEDHSCTDVPWLLLFVLFCIGMGFICGFSIATGAAARLLSGYDSYGNICGQKNVKVEGIVNSGLDLTHRKYVFFLDPCNIDLVHQKIKSIALCVSACPRKELKTLADIQNFAETNGSTLCSYELQPSEYTTDPRAAKLCPKFPVPESAPIPFFHRCAPVNISCYAKFAEALITFVSDSSVLHRLISGVMTSKEIIMGLCLLSLVLSMILMIIIRYISRVLVWILTILVILGSLGGTGVLWWLYAKQRMSLETQVAKDNLQALLIYAIAATVFTVILFLIMLIMRKRVALTIALFHVAGKVFIHLPLLVFQPFWTFFVLILFWTYWIAVLLFLGTTGSPVPNEEGFVEFRMAGPLKYMWWYHVVGFIWISEFILACQQMTVAGAVVTYYFTREKRNLPFTPILASVNRLVCYHLGTVAKGSFIITLVKIPRMILMYIHTQLKGKENACARCMLKACICCLWCLEKCLTYLNQNAYTATAINSTNFCTSAKDAFVILVENALRVAAINTVGDFMLFLGKVLIVCSTGLAGIMLLNYQRDYTIWVLPLIIVCLFAFLVAHCFLSIYEMVVDVLFLCFAIDTKYNDGSPGREFYMDKVLMEFVENSRKSMKEVGRGGGAEGRELKPMETTATSEMETDAVVINQSIPSGGKGLDSPSGTTSVHRQGPCCGPKVFCSVSVFCSSTEDLLGTLEEILPKLQKDVSVWIMAKDSAFPDVHTLLDKIEAASEDPVPVNRCSANSLKSPVLYIFTSGTTGLPKAAVISHLQILKGAAGLWAFGATSEDIIYITLPLYHSAASLLGIGGCIELGATCVLKKKFSASQFWSDCRKYNVTVIQYIGELCRYLCNQPVKEEEKNHKVRLAVGNGVRNDVWREFLDRFGAVKICEFYGATEGNICFMNHTGKIGSVGRTNFFYKLFFPFDLIKYDFQKDEPIRNKHGWCEKVKKGEAGLLISKVNAKNPFFGYAGNKRHTEKKLLCEVFKKGDLYFNTGDLMVQDHDNFLYFWDRIGDTFRWKGENVATTEVSDVIAMLDFIQEANVYGVSVPDHEGKAGMASLILKHNASLDLEQMYKQVVTYLPSYACPLFLRVQEKMEMTGTFKQQKFRLVDEGFNPSAITDPLYFLDNSKKAYILLTKELHEMILSGKMKL